MQNLKSIINEMPELMLHGESGGQILIDRKYGHYRPATSEETIWVHMIVAGKTLALIDWIDLTVLENNYLNDN